MRGLTLSSHQHDVEPKWCDSELGMEKWVGQWSQTGEG